MKSSIINLDSMSHPENFTKLNDAIKSNRQQLEDFIKSYSDSYEFDSVDKDLNYNLALIEDYREFSENQELLLMDILEVMRKHNEKFCKNSNLKRLQKKLKIEIKLHDDIDDFGDFQYFYARGQEQSNLLIIYNYHKKKFSQLKINHFFPAKCNTFFHLDEKNNDYEKDKKFKFSLFVSGGLNKKQRIVYDRYSKDQVFDLQNLAKQRFQSLRDFYEIKVIYDIFEENIEYEIKELTFMNNARNSHSIVKFGDYLIAISGANTKSCEIYCFMTKRWSNLPDLPSYCVNSSLAVFDGYLYCFCGATTVSPFDSIFKLSLNYLDNFIKNEKGFKDSLRWEEVRFYYSTKNYNLRQSPTKLRRGMAPLVLGSHTMFLFGGFDNDNIYDDVLEVTFLNKQAEERIQNEKKEKELNEQLKDAKNKNNNKEKEKTNKEKISDNIFEKSDKEIEENLLCEMRNNNNLNNNNENYNDNYNEENNFIQNNNEEIPINEDIQEHNIGLNDEIFELKIEKKLTTLPNKTFFNSNISLVNNTILMVDGFNNAIEYNIENNQFCYYT